MKKLCLFVLLLSTMAVAKDKPVPIWQSGTLTDISTQRGTRLVGVDGVINERRDDHTYYLIETPDIIYVAERGMSRHHDKPLAVTINKAVRFYIQGQDFYLQDEQGKEHKLTLETQKAKK